MPDMDRVEFTKVMAYIATAIEKPMSRERAEIFYDLLKDLPLAALQAAAKVVVLEHPWSTFPSVAELKQAAVTFMQGKPHETTAAEAWDLACRSLKKYDPEIDGQDSQGYWAKGKLWPSQWAYLTRDVPKRVVEAMQTFNVDSMLKNDGPDGVARAQFMKIYDQLLTRDKRSQLISESLHEEIKEIPSTEAAKHIGHMPT